MTIPGFTADGLLPVGEYEVTIAELRASILVLGASQPHRSAGWDSAWRDKLVSNLAVLAEQLYQVNDDSQ